MVDGGAPVVVVVPEGDTFTVAELVTDDNVAKVSVVGVGMRSHSGVAATLFDALAKAKINIQLVSTSEIKISVGVEPKDAEEATRVVHAAFGLGG